ncbi:MAG: EpsI family protein [Armatimonadetes bacterium]|nr:EpsI family protein [Armatimonadota bacterium]
MSEVYKTPAIGVTVRPSYKPNYPAVFALMAATTALGTFWELRPEPTGEIADVKNIPMSVGNWQSAGDVEIDPATMAQIKADTYIQRRYQNPEGKAVDILLVYRRYGRREFAHRPELCFPAAGYSIVSKDRTSLPYAGRDAEAVHLNVDGSRVPAPNTTITYFFASGKTTECDFVKQQVLMALERVIPNKNGWTFVRLTTAQTPGATDPEMVKTQQDFMRAMAPALEKVITTDAAAK